MWKRGESRDRSIPGARRTGKKKKSDLIRRKKRETDDGGEAKEGSKIPDKKK